MKTCVPQRRREIPVARLVRGGTARHSSSRRSLFLRAGLPGLSSDRVLRRSREAGFTLLELLIATAVGAIVLLAIQTAFFGALRLNTTAHARVDRDLELQRALAIIRRDFSGLVAPAAGTGNTLAGQFQSETFSSVVSADFGERLSPELSTSSGKIDGWNQFSEVQRVAYFLAPSKAGGETKDLVRVVTRNLLPTQETPGDALVILRGVQEAAVEFFDGSGWTSNWDSEETATLPTGLKFRVLLAPPDPSQPAAAPTELIVPVFVTTAQSATDAATAATP